MVNIILKYLEQPLKAYMPYLDVVDSPVIRLASGKIYKGSGSEKQEVCISDSVGNALYVRQTQPETFRELKALSSCNKQYQVNARCRALFYTFGTNDFKVSEDKVKSGLQAALNKINFNQYTGTSTDIVITINSASFDAEKLFKDETGVDFSGNEWPIIVAVDFTLSYNDVNCNSCDIEDIENPFIWNPDVEPQNCETKAICDAVAACDVVIILQEQTASLQYQIDNLPQSGITCDDLPECQTIQEILQSISDIIAGLPSSYFTCVDLAYCQTIIDIVSDISSISSRVGTNTMDISTLNGQVSQLIIDLGTLTTDLSNHTSNTSNPHQVTLEQARNQNNSLSGDINANTNTIINLKDAVNPQEPITKMQFDTYVSTVGGQRGNIDCSANPNYPASNKGDRWEVTVAGIIGGALGITVQVYDEIVCKTTSVAGNQATVGANFYVVQGNLERATETVAGYIQLATDVEVQAGTENTKAVTALKLWNFFVAFIQSGLTASQYIKTDASKNLISVAAIPATDVTEDSTHRFATDAEKTLWNTVNLVAANNFSDLNNIFTSRNNLEIREMFLTAGNQTTTSITASSIAGLQTVTLQANKRYYFEGIIHIGCSSTGGVKLRAVIPTGATIFMAVIGQTSNSTSQAVSQITTSATLTSVAFSTGNNALGYAKISGEVQMSSTTGTVQFGFASGVNAQTSTIYQLGTCISYKKLN